jgi:hypothetical protein
MPNFAGALLGLLILGVLLIAIFKTKLPSSLLAIGGIFAVMAVLHHYAEAGLQDYALDDVQEPFLRYLAYRGAVTAGGGAALLLALAWLYRHRVSRLGFYPAVAAVAGSGLWTGGAEFARLAPTIRPLRSSASLAPLTYSPWWAAMLPIAAAKARFSHGGIIIGEACRPDLQPKLAGRAPLLRYGGSEGSGHLLVFAGSGGYKTTGTVVPSALEWPSAPCSMRSMRRAVYPARRAHSVSA